jgi:hypothetical protein
MEPADHVSVYDKRIMAGGDGFATDAPQAFLVLRHRERGRSREVEIRLEVGKKRFEAAYSIHYTIYLLT